MIDSIIYLIYSKKHDDSNYLKQSKCVCMFSLIEFSAYFSHSTIWFDHIILFYYNGVVRNEEIKHLFNVRPAMHPLMLFVGIADKRNATRNQVIVVPFHLTFMHRHTNASEWGQRMGPANSENQQFYVG